MGDSESSGGRSYLWPEALRGIEAKIRRAKEQTDALKEAVNGFTESDKHRWPIERNDDGTEYRAGALFDPVPDEIGWGVLTGEILHNLRSALDGLMWQLVLANGGEPGSRTEFPIFRDRAVWTSLSGPKVSGASDHALTLIESIQPFNGTPDDPGRSRLWLLHVLNNTDKHRLVLPIITALVDWKVSQFPKGAEIQVARAAQHGKATARILPSQPTERIDVKLRLAYNVSLDIGGSVYEIGQLLFDLAEETESVVRAFIDQFT